MEFRIADTFTGSLAKLTGDEQKAAKTAAFDLQLNPAHPSLQFHKLDKAKTRTSGPFESAATFALSSTAPERACCCATSTTTTKRTSGLSAGASKHIRRRALPSWWRSVSACKRSRFRSTLKRSRKRPNGESSTISPKAHCSRMAFLLNGWLKSWTRLRTVCSKSRDTCPRRPPKHC